MAFSSGFRTLLPDDLFDSYIIPDILSEHLHRLLVEAFDPTWHPFYTLPLVSRTFYNICRMMRVNIFGEGDGSTILRVLEIAQSFWDNSRCPPSRSRPMNDSFTYAQLMSSKSLIQVYICTGIAHCFFKSDIEWNLELEAMDLQDAELELMDHDWSGEGRRFRMRDDNMHRVYLPLTCAMRLCDYIKQERLAYIIAEHLAEIIPRYSTEPILLKYTQDLETYIDRKHRVGMETWVDWTSRTLRLIEEAPDLLLKMQNMGKLVGSFNKTAAIPMAVLQEIKIIDALHGIMESDWGLDTELISSHAADLLLEWGALEL